MNKYTFEINRKNRYDEEILKEVIKSNNTIKDVLIDLGLKPVGTNYKTLKRYIEKYGIKYDNLIYLKNRGKILYTKENLTEAINSSNCVTDVLRNLGIITSGSNFKTIKKYIIKYNIDTSHFNPEKVRIEKLKKLLKKNIKPLSDILIENSTYTSTSSLKKRLYHDGIKIRVCELCGQTEEWKGKHMSLILDHINGVHNDNRIENLRIVCPNCNATLDTHCGKNNSKRNKKKIKNNIPINEKVDFRILLTEEKIVEYKNRRKIERPSLEQLLEEIKELGYCGTGRKYGVSDNAIRKWVKNYEKNNF